MRRSTFLGARLSLSGLALFAVLLMAGCGADSTPLDIAHVPLPARSHIVMQRYTCFAPGECWRHVVLAGDAPGTAAQLKAAERMALKRSGWRFTDGVTRHAVAADSPDSRFFVSFETASEELLDDRDARLIWGDTQMVGELTRSAITRRPALAIALEPGLRK